MNVRLILYGIVAVLLVVSWGGACVIYQAAEMGTDIAPVPPREFERFTVVAVGTGGPYENPERGGPSMAVGLGSQIWLVDAGRGVAESLRSASIPVDQPTTVFLTSLAAENCLGLDDLLYTGWLAPRDQPIRLIGPPGTADLARGLTEAYAAARRAGQESLALPADGARLEIVEAGDGFSLEEGGVKATARTLAGSTPAVAWHFEHDGRTVAITPPGMDGDALVAAVEGVEWWIHEAVYVPPPEDAESAGILTDPDRLAREGAHHTSILEIGALAARARVAGLGVVRMRPPPLFDFQVTSFITDDFTGETWVPDDGDELEP